MGIQTDRVDIRGRDGELALAISGNAGVAGDLEHSNGNIGFYGTAPAVKHANIPTVPTGVSAAAGDNANAINSILGLLQSYGLME